MKTLLTVVSLFVLVACNNAPRPPAINPVGIKPSVNKAWPCKVTDEANLTFKCAKTSVPLTSIPELEGGYAVSAKEVKAWTNYGREMQAYVKEHCE